MTARADAGARAGRRFLLAALGLVALALVLGPLAVLVHGRWSPLVELDEATTRRAEALGADVPPVREAAQVLTHLGDPLGLTVAAALVGLLLWRSGHGRLALLVVLGRLGAALLSSTTKAVVDRTRPVFEEPFATALGSSFPSGHALGAAGFWSALAVVLLWLGRGRRGALLALAVGVPVVVAATRVLLGVHYLSDVLAGVVLGLGWTAVCTALLVVWSREEGRPVEPTRRGLGQRHVT